MGSTQNSNRQSCARVMSGGRSDMGSTMARQRGLGMISIFVIISVSIFIGLFTFKVAPNYFENWTVSKIASDVAANPELMKQPRSKVYDYLSQAFRTNSLWDLKPEDAIILTKDSRRGYIVTVQYEKRDTLFSNIDVVTTFNREATATQ